MKKNNLFVLLFLFAISANSQESFFPLSYNQIRGASGIKVINNFSNGDLALIGENTPSGSKKKSLFIIRTDVSGNVIWRKEFFSDRILAVNDFLIDMHDNIIIAAEQYEEGNRESLFLLGLDAYGKQLFSSHFNEVNGEVEAYDILLDRDGGFLITGFCKLPTIISDVFFRVVKEDQYLYLLKVNTVGEKVWSKYIEEDYFSSTGRKLIIDKGLRLNIFANNHKDNNENSIKLFSSIDNIIYDEYHLISSKRSILTDVYFDGENFYLTGIVINDKNKETDYYDMFLIKINASYELQYNKIISSKHNDKSTRILLDKGKIFLFGKIYNKDNKELYSLCLDQQGSFISFASYNNEYKDISFTDVLMTNKGVLAVGSKWEKKRTGILFNTMHLVDSKSQFNVIDGDFKLKKLGQGQFINLSKEETIAPVNIKEWKY
tara:strand:+ start:1009 stop:2307 length:1299 start_codon:yes stop_codon:yes gene_type:complete